MNTDAYFARIGYTGPRRASLDVLRRLHECHTQAIPFENLNPLLGLPVPLDAASLERKMVDGRRGGWCFEQNWLFRRVLESMGFRVRGLAARVLWGNPDGPVGARSHMVLEVDIDGETFIADVGFGGMTLTAPLRLQWDVEQETPHETFRLGRSSVADYVLEVDLDGWRPVYAFGREAQLLPDYEVSSFYLCHHPDSFFRRDLVAARAFPGGRFVLRNNRLSTYRRGAPPESRVLSTPEALSASLEADFTLALPEGVPGFRTMLERLSSQSA